MNSDLITVNIPKDDWELLVAIVKGGGIRYEGIDDLLQDAEVVS